MRRNDERDIAEDHRIKTCELLVGEVCETASSRGFAHM